MVRQARGTISLHPNILQHPGCLLRTRMLVWRRIIGLFCTNILTSSLFREEIDLEGTTPGQFNSCRHDGADCGFWPGGEGLAGGAGFLAGLADEGECRVAQFGHDLRCRA